MNLTARLKQWLVDNAEVSPSATDDEFKKAAGAALVSGDLSMEKLAELTEKKDEPAEELDKFFKDMAGTLSDIKDFLKKGNQPDDEEEEGKPKPKPKDEEEGKNVCPACSKEMTKAKDGNLECKECGIIKKAAKPSETKGVETKPEEKKGEPHKPSDLEKVVFSMSGGFSVSDDDDDEEKTFDVRVKEAAEQYDTTKSALVYPDYNKKGRPHPFVGRPVKDYSEAGAGRKLDSASEQEEAIVGAFGKFIVNAVKLKSRSLSFQQLPQHDKELLCYAMENLKWGGSTTGDDFADIKDRKLTAIEQKALIDDSTSGGLEAAPIVFDDMVIQTPLLHGELYPLVNTIPLDRGRRIEGVATGTVTGSWGGVDDTAISLFNTASYVSAFDTTIYRWEGSVRIGLDFLSDTPIDFGQHFTSQYGERLLEDLDDVVAAGNGTTQPEGVINKSGTTSVAFGGATSLGNYESLRFGVAKAEHRANVASSAVFCGTETSYQRARAIPVGTNDARRIFGMDYDDYAIMQRPYKINESLSNQQIFYAILARYRMYRRRGLTMRTSTEGDTLIRRNEMLMFATARFGGQLERGAVAAVTTTAPA